jgi:hypothetical protein
MVGDMSTNDEPPPPPPPPVHTENCTLKHIEMNYCLDCACERANEQIRKWREQQEATDAAR